MIALFNPLTKDFVYRWRNEDNQEVFLTMRSREITSFDEPQAKHMKKHLADAILNERGVKTNHEDEFKEVLKEIEVNLDES